MPSVASETTGDCVSVSCNVRDTIVVPPLQVRLTGTPVASRNHRIPDQQGECTTGGVNRGLPPREHKVDWERLLERETRRCQDGVDRLDPAQLVRLGNAAYGAGLVLLMLGRRQEAGSWLARAAARWQESFAHATPTSWGRPVGAIKAALLADGADDAGARACWALELGSDRADSPIGRYAGALALLVLERWDGAAVLAAGLEGEAAFPAPVARALVAIAGADRDAAAAAITEVLESFERRVDHLEDVPVADTGLVLAALARSRGLEPALRSSPLCRRYGGVSRRLSRLAGRGPIAEDVDRRLRWRRRLAGARRRSGRGGLVRAPLPSALPRREARSVRPRGASERHRDPLDEGLESCLPARHAPLAFGSCGDPEKSEATWPSAPSPSSSRSS